MIRRLILFVLALAAIGAVDALCSQTTWWYA